MNNYEKGIIFVILLILFTSIGSVVCSRSIPMKTKWGYITTRECSTCTIYDIGLREDGVVMWRVVDEFPNPKKEWDEEKK